MMAMTSPVLCQSPDTTSGKKPLKLAKGTNPLPGKLVFPPRPKRPDYVGRLVKLPNGGYDAVHPELPLKTTKEKPVKPDDTVKAKQVLRRMARFLEAQDSIAFSVDYYIDEQGTMGFVGGNSTVYRFAYAKPNRFLMLDTNSPNPKYRTKICSNGEHVMRISFDRVFVEDAPSSLTELVKLPSVRPISVWNMDAPRLMSLFDPDALESLMKSCKVYHRGTRDYGAVKTDHIVIDGRGKNLRLFHQWHLYVSRGETPVPVRLVPNMDMCFDPKLRNRQRFSATDWRFGDWGFNDPATEKVFAMTLPNKPLVDSMDRIIFGERKEVHPSVGKQLPKFVTRDAAGTLVKSEDFSDDKPYILLFWRDGMGMPGWWPYLEKVEQRFGKKGIKLYTVYVGQKTDKKMEEDFKISRDYYKWQTDPFVLRCANKPTDIPFMRAYVVAADGKVHQVEEMSKHVATQLGKQIQGLLAGKDMAVVNRKAMTARNAARKQRRTDLTKAFAARGSGSTR
ncbi:MAG: DUF2092 domain-containing protein [Gemmataceae bacterium]